MDAEFKQIMNQSITWEQYTGKNDEGDLTYAAPVILKGYVAGRQKLFSSESENVIINGTVIYIDPDNQPVGVNVLDVKANDKLTPPNGGARVVDTTDVYYDLEEANRLYLLEVIVK